MVMGNERAHLKRSAEDMFGPFHGAVHSAFRQRTAAGMAPQAVPIPDLLASSGPAAAGMTPPTAPIPDFPDSSASTSASFTVDTAMGNERAHLKRPAEDTFGPFHGAVHSTFRQRMFQSTLQASVAAGSPTPDQQVSVKTLCSIDLIIDESSQHLKRTAAEMMETIHAFHQREHQAEAYTQDGNDDDSTVTI
jgi:predicted N-formylglutamate amidohydrolase